MTSTRSVISFSSVRSSHLITLRNKLKNLVVVVDELFLETNDLDSVHLVLALLQLVVVIQQVVQFASVDLVHGHRHGEVSRVVLPIVYTALKKILHSDRLNAVHSVSLAGTGLSVSKDRDDTLVEYQIKNRTHLEEVKLLVGIVLIERIVKLEFIVFNSLGDAIYLVSAVMNNNLGVAHRDHIDLTIGKLVLENWSFLEADRNLHLVCQRMHPSCSQLGALRLDHMLEVNVDLDTL